MRVLSWQDAPQHVLMESVIIIKKGGCVVYPTDTVYGIATDPMRKECVEYVNTIKGRKVDHPISICISSFEWLEDKVEKRVLEIVRGYLPGSYTLLLPTKVRIPAMGRSHLLGVRMVNHPCVQALIERVGPITSTSANLHGMLPPRTVSDAVNQLADRVELYIDGGETPGRASTVISLENEKIRIIRE